MNYTEQLHIAAAGQGSRLRSFMDTLGYAADCPKHLLPTGHSSGETLVGRIVRQALDISYQPVIYARPEHILPLTTHPDMSPSANVVVALPDASFFGPFVRPLLQKKVIAAGASGDHYVEQGTWKEVLDTHDTDPFPITFVAARTKPFNNGLVYRVRDTGQITGFQRVGRTSEEDLVNIGLYVIAPSSGVLRSLGAIGIDESSLDQPILHSPEVIADQLIADGLVGVHVLPAQTAFNVNDPEVYTNLLKHTHSVDTSTATH
jgi:hypothetical protein